MHKSAITRAVLVGILLGAVGHEWLRPAHGDGPPARAEYDYTVAEFEITESSSRMAASLGGMGSAGWHVVGVIPTHAGSMISHRVILERLSVGRPAPKPAVPGAPLRPVPQADDRDAPGGRR